MGPKFANRNFEGMEKLKNDQQKRFPTIFTRIRKQKSTASKKS